jgi:hypothetical protein
MARVFHDDPHRRAPADAAPAPVVCRTRDISALAWTLLLIGLAALAGALVLPDRPSMLAPLSGALALVGLGLMRRAAWSRSAAIVLFAALIHGQLSRRSLESDLLQPFIESLRGVHDASHAGGLLVTAATPTTLGLAGAVCGALLCLAMGCFVVRLASHAARTEFEPRQPLPAQAQSRRDSPGSPSR